MEVINTDGLVLFGPGSEWLWFMLQFAAIALTGIAVYRQFRAQQAGNAFAQYQAFEEQWHSERMRTMKLRLATALRGGSDPDTEILAGAVIGFFEQIEVLHRRGYLETEILFGGSSSIGEDAARWWTVLEDWVRRTREEYGTQELAGFERLAVQAQTWMTKSHVPPFATDAASIAGRLDWMIDGQTRNLRIEREIREAIATAPVEATAEP